MGYLDVAHGLEYKLAVNGETRSCWYPCNRWNCRVGFCACTLSIAMRHAIVGLLSVCAASRACRLSWAIHNQGHVAWFKMDARAGYNLVESPRIRTDRDHFSMFLYKCLLRSVHRPTDSQAAGLEHRRGLVSIYDPHDVLYEGVNLTEWSFILPSRNPPKRIIGPDNPRQEEDKDEDFSDLVDQLAAVVERIPHPS